MFVKNKILFISGIILMLSGIAILTYNQLREPDYLAYSISDFEDTPIEDDSEKINNPIEVKEKKSKKKKVRKEVKEKVIPVIDTIIEIPEEIKEVVIEVPPIIEVKQEKIKGEPAKKEQFYIISGVFSVEENATIHVNSLKKEGYNNALVIGKVNDLFNVSFGIYSTREDAQKDLNEIKEKFQPSAWILYI